MPGEQHERHGEALEGRTRMSVFEDGDARLQQTDGVCNDDELLVLGNPTFLSLALQREVLASGEGKVPVANFAQTLIFNILARRGFPWLSRRALTRAALLFCSTSMLHGGTGTDRNLSVYLVVWKHSSTCGGCPSADWTQMTCSAFCCCLMCCAIEVTAPAL